MAVQPINVNKADINDPSPPVPEMPLDLMGLFFFAYRDFVGDADLLLGRRGFGRAHHRVLYFVNLRPGMPVADLLNILKITKQSLARVLRQLIDSGLIEQRPGPVDRRQRLLYATAEGRAFFETLSKTQASRINAAVAALPADGREIVKRFLTEMVEAQDHPMLARLKLAGVE
jgi:DNA-binding MarR family transcriptional regulator